MMASRVWSRFQAEYEAARSRLCPADQIINAMDALFDLTPVSQAPAIATRAKWEPWLPGQPVALIWEFERDPFECEEV